MLHTLNSMLRRSDIIYLLHTRFLSTSLETLHADIHPRTTNPLHQDFSVSEDLGFG